MEFFHPIHNKIYLSFFSRCNDMRQFSVHKRTLVSSNWTQRQSLKIVRPLPAYLIGEADVFSSTLLSSLCNGKLTPSEIKYALEHCDYLFLVENAKQEILGFACLHKLYSKALYVDFLVGHKVGGFLVDILKTFASEHVLGFSYILLESLPCAEGFYKKQGFVSTGQHSKEKNPFYSWKVDMGKKKKIQNTFCIKQELWAIHPPSLYKPFQPLSLT
jgi:hypothetical protein